ncbi:MAG: L-rhamnose mutarotase [Chthoniobacteraceae bacterium]
MMRKSFLMYVNPGATEEYLRRHHPIWPELKETLKEHGVSNYSIYLNRSNNQLIGYVEIEDEAKWNAIAQTDVCKKWWHYMADSMVTNPDESPRSDTLCEVFHLD